MSESFSRALAKVHARIESDLELLKSCGVTTGLQVVSHDFEPLRMSLTWRDEIVRDYFIEWEPAWTFADVGYARSILTCNECGARDCAVGRGMCEPCLVARTGP